MKRFPLILIAALIALSSCMEDKENSWEEQLRWRENNLVWLGEQAERKNDDGTPYYTKVVPDWDKKAYVLVHYFNDRSLTQGNLSPLYTSTVDVKYRGELYDGTAFDSSYNNVPPTYPADSIFRTGLSGVISGWQIVLQDMRVGDTCEVVIPYSLAYGTSQSG
ncbi:MAG: FKBP-type peptidyl-prolyl cis-trans isomerase, partial [Muribaculaceae bacterium]|nr:FKBP-type peptidyl-prolyl cis-trans isomerase [Muribaculaceae bacterium]